MRAPLGRGRLGDKAQRLEDFIKFIAERPKCLAGGEVGGRTARFVPKLVCRGAHLAKLAGELERHLHPCKIQAAIIDQVLHLTKPLDIPVRIEPEIALRARWSNQPLAFIFPQRLRVHLDETRRYTDYKKWFAKSRGHSTPLCFMD